MAEKDIDPTEAEDLLLGLYSDEVENSDGGFFEFIGLPRDASWGHFRRHYDTGGQPDAERAFGDLRRYPPVAEFIEQQKIRTGRKDFEPEDLNALLRGTNGKKH